VGFGPPQPATWSYHAADCQPTAPVPLVSVAGPVCWNSLPDYLKTSGLSFNCFRQQLKHFYSVNIDTSPSTALAH